MASRRTRRVVKNSLTNIEGEVNALLEDYEETKRVTLTGLTKLLSEKTKRFVETRGKSLKKITYTRGKIKKKSKIKKK